MLDFRINLDHMPDMWYQFTVATGQLKMSVVKKEDCSFYTYAKFLFLLQYWLIKTHLYSKHKQDGERQGRLWNLVNKTHPDWCSVWNYYVCHIIMYKKFIKISLFVYIISQEINGHHNRLICSQFER